MADIACGVGWSSIAIARAYPGVRVDGFDLDTRSIERARQNAVDAGVTGQVRFEQRDAADPSLSGTYDLVTVIVADERVAEQFTAPGDAIERLNYGFSVLHCLPSCREEEPSAATGTCMRPDTMRRYAEEAGFTSVEVLPIEHDFWRFYRLRG